MKNNIRIILLFLAFGHYSIGQNNYIFNGGESQGFDYASIEIKSNNSIFSGGSNDGFDHNYHSQVMQKWNGGSDDGFSFGALDLQDVNSIWNGSIGDGMAFMTLAQKSNNELYHGGSDDGFSYAYIDGASNNLVFSGGGGDGFSASGISKLIWDGDISKDWLMADNWNIPIVPTMNHSVCIPGGLTNYPKLSAVLGISIVEDHTYASKDVMIMAGAQINGIENIRVVVNGNLVVAGEMFINAGNDVRIEGRADGLIKVLSGGSIRID